MQLYSNLLDSRKDKTMEIIKNLGVEELQVEGRNELVENNGFLAQ